MLVILEGVDGAGKTTMAETLRGLAPETKILHKGPLTRDVISEYTLDIQHYRPGRGEDVVCDRWHLGEQVYGPILRGESAFTRSSFVHVEKALQARGALLVHLDQELGVLRSRLRARGDDLVNEGMLGDLQRGYRTALRESRVPRLTFDGRWDVEQLTEIVLRSARHLEEACVKLNPFTTYVGDPHPRYLLLGETRNENFKSDVVPEAAFTPASATSGKYLLDHLTSTELYGCGLANACEEDVGELWETLGKPPTVALGVHATGACRESGIEFGAVPHPQFVRRFHHSSGQEYGALIREVLSTGEDRLKWRP